MGCTEPGNCENDWEIEEAARTLIRAREVVKDKKLYAKVKKELERQAECALEAANEEAMVGKTQKRLDKAFGSDD